jgi:hypothetical protein
VSHSKVTDKEHLKMLGNLMQYFFCQIPQMTHPSSIFLRLSPFKDTPLFRDDRRGLTSYSLGAGLWSLFENARQSNAIFLLPNTANDTPAPGFYSMKSAIGNSEQSISFKGRKIGPFQSNKGPTYIPIEMNEREAEEILRSRFWLP